jgi:hypothetical protein
MVVSRDIIHYVNIRKKEIHKGIEMKPIKVKWYKKWQDVPIDSGGQPFKAAVKDRTIYAIKGETTDWALEHEKAHIIKNHPTFPYTAKEWILQELEASKYAYKKLGKPIHLKFSLGGILRVCRKNYRLTYKQTLPYIHMALVKVNAPKTWFDDYNSLVQEIKRKYG